MLIGDPLSCLSTYSVTDAEDNQDQIVLKPAHFKHIAATAFEFSLLESEVRNCTDREIEVAQALQVLRFKGPRRLANNIIE